MSWFSRRRRTASFTVRITYTFTRVVRPDQEPEALARTTIEETTIPRSFEEFEGNSVGAKVHAQRTVEYLFQHGFCINEKPDRMTFIPPQQIYSVQILHLHNTAWL